MALAASIESTNLRRRNAREEVLSFIEFDDYQRLKWAKGNLEISVRDYDGSSWLVNECFYTL